MFKQHLLHSVAFAAVLWFLGSRSCPLLAVYLISACVFLSLACIVFVVLHRGIVVLKDSSSLCFLPHNPNCRLSSAGFILYDLFCLLINLFIHVFLHWTVWL